MSMVANKDKRVMDNIEDLRQKYGNIFHLYLGMGVDLIVISGTYVSFTQFK